MKIKTTRFGEISVIEKSFLRMQDGMLGFRREQRFVLLGEESDTPFKWLQCVDEPALAFIVVNPLDFFPNYDVELSDEEARSLGLSCSSDAAMVTTVTIDGDSGAVSTNLLGPIVINSKTLSAKQIVVQDERYGTKHLIGRKIYQDIELGSLAAA